MSKRNNTTGFVTENVRIPEELLQSVFFDRNGRQFSFQPRKQRRFVLFSRSILELRQGEDTFSQSFSQFAGHVCKKMLEMWLEHDIEPGTRVFAKQVSPILDSCFKEGERDFRKAFVEKLGTQGALVFNTLLSEYFDEIVSLWEKEQPDKPAQTFFYGPISPHTRFVWRSTSPQRTYDLVCLEFPPALHTVKIFGTYHQLAFPWLCILVGFMNGVFHSSARSDGGNSSAIFVFYRPDRLNGLEDELFFPNLPHRWNEHPYTWCLGYSIPTIRMSNPEWENKLISFFWQTAFVNERWTSWSEARDRIPEVKSVKDWEELSKETPERMRTLPWKKCEKNLSSFAESVLEWAGSQQPQKTNTKNTEQQKNRALLLERFRGRLEEELHFLGSTMVIPPHLEEKVKKITHKELQVLAHTLGNALKKHSRVLRNLPDQWFEARVPQRD